MHNIKLYGATVGELRIDKSKDCTYIKIKTKFSKMDEILVNTMNGFAPILKKFKPNIVVIHEIELNLLLVVCLLY